MKYRHLGRTGLKVSRLCLGTMTFGEKAWGCDQKTSTALVDTYLDAGGNFIDTADLYDYGVSETYLGNAIKGRRDNIVLATKCWFPFGDDINAKGASRKHIIDACDASLKRLGTDYVDLYQMHGWDRVVPIEETLRAMDDLVKAGKTRYIGCSNYHAWQLMKALACSEANGLHRFASLQPLYNLLIRDIEKDILPCCEDQGVGIMTWSPLAAGMLTGKYTRAPEPSAESRLGQPRPDKDRYWSDRSFDIIERLVMLAQKVEKTPAQLALAWLLKDRRVSTVIVGSTKPKQLAETLEVGDWDIPDDIWSELEECSRPDFGYPHSWLELTAPMVYGDTEW
jgi:1-deoxyxylulose-5-phosphate synthase